ncbi:permease prefix domain 1-containing protein [Olivibacter sitiensis]|uniref:permease prefix domain 1-containing protein n=1 Tax=Olivibacter sitiensis TaxID=376470 RepID=UPI0004086CEC|nr:permease prefix domain 1-containing protein [Olivibacter sitiensis]
MEKPQFDLQQAISRSIQDLYEQGTITNSDRHELQAHLEDSAEGLITTGLSEEEAFLIAQKRLGRPELLNEEYAKVNHNLRTDKTWALLLAGFAAISTFIALISYSGSIYYYLLERFGLSNYTWPVVAFLCLQSTLFLFIALKKREVSNFLRDQVEMNPLRSIVFSFTLLALVKGMQIAVLRYLPKSFSYPASTIYGFQGDKLIEFATYVSLFCLFVSLLSIFFSLRSPTKGTWRAAFEKPSIAFLMLFGIGTACFAASTRSLSGLLPVPMHFTLFGLVYLMGAALISYYNENSKLHLFFFGIFGFCAELGVGVVADIDRAQRGIGQIYTPFFILSLIVGLMAGWYMGNMLRGKDAIPSR